MCLDGDNHSNRMRKSLLVSFWCALLSNCLALKAAGFATPKVSACRPIEVFGAGADNPTLNLFVAEPESARENGEHASHSWLPVRCCYLGTCAVCRRVSQEKLVDSEKVWRESSVADKGQAFQTLADGGGKSSSIASNLLLCLAFRLCWPQPSI